jgi:HmuY protein
VTAAESSPSSPAAVPSTADPVSLDRHRPAWVAPAILSAVILIAAVLFVARSLREPELPVFAPTSTAAGEAGDSLVGPITFTVDAESSDPWQYFDFSSGGLTTSSDPLGWDLGVRRFHLIANGGAGFPGSGGIADLGTVDFHAVTEAPDTGYIETRAARDTVNAAIDHWYRYSWISHILEPAGHVYVVRTADGRYAKVRILSYYCTGARPGCLTFEYVYQGSGGRSFTSDRPGGSSALPPN